MNNHRFEFSVQVLNSKVKTKEYLHNNKTYIEGRRNSEYELYFNNKTSNEVLVIFSVDGLSVIEGKPASKNSKGYIIRPWDSIKVPGWTLSDNKVAKFQFRPQGDRDNSTYVEELKSEGFEVDISNQGVIGCMVFEKRVVTYPVYRTWVYPQLSTCETLPTIYHNSSAMTRGHAGMATSLNSNDGKSTFLNAGLNAACYDVAQMATYYDPTASTFKSTETSLGTGFGDETTFETKTENFERGNLLWTAVINYDTLNSLKKMGVVIEKSEVDKAFPGDTDYCHVPRSKRKS